MEAEQREMKAENAFQKSRQQWGSADALSNPTPPLGKEQHSMSQSTYVIHTRTQTQRVGTNRCVQEVVIKKDVQFTHLSVLLLFLFVCLH